MSIRFVVLLLIFCACNINLKAQKIEVSVALDSNNIVIGDHIGLKFKAVVPKDVNVEFPALKDTIVKGLEILKVEKLKIKNLKGNLKQMILEYKVTSFDTGVYIIPSYPIKIKQLGHDNIIRTDKLHMGVSTFKVDINKGYADIVPPRKTPVNIAEILPYLLWGVLGVFLILLFLFFLRKWKRKESIFKIIEKPKDPAHIVAFRELDKMKSEKLWERGNVKEFYTQLTDILRIYIEDQFGILAMEQTSIETIEDIRKESFFSNSLVESLETILTNADFVKFAKATPLGNENQQALTYAYDIVSVTYEAVLEKNREDQIEQFEDENA